MRALSDLERPLEQGDGAPQVLPAGVVSVTGGGRHGDVTPRGLVYHPAASTTASPAIPGLADAERLEFTGDLAAARRGYDSLAARISESDRALVWARVARVARGRRHLLDAPGTTKVQVARQGETFSPKLKGKGK